MMSSGTSTSWVITAIVIVFVGCLFIAPPTVARSISGVDESVGLFEQANEAYREGRYEDAVAKYEQLRQRDPDTTVLFNLGNAWFKLHQTAGGRAEGALGRAIGLYEQVLRISPRHRDARANLEHARTLVEDALEEVETGSFVRVLFWPSLDELMLVSLVLVWMSCSILVIRRRSRREVVSEICFWLLFIMIPFSLMSGGWTAGRILADSGRDDAVILARRVDVRSAPQEGATTVFSLHEGSVVSVVRESRGWLQVSLPNGFAGWVRHEATMRID